MAADEFEESVERQRQAIQRRLQAQEQFGATLGSGIQASIDSLRRFRAETGQTLDALDSLRVGFEETFLGAINVGMDAFAESSIEAFEAVQEGTKSASQAWEDLGKAVIRSIVQQALVQAIQNTALGFGAIARYDFAAAGAYFTSAALWGGLAAGAFGIASVTGAYEGDDETASGEGGGSRTNPTLRPGQGGTSNPNIDGTAGTTAGGLGGFESAGSRERDSEGNVIIVLPSRPFTTRGEISQDLRRINRQSARQRGETISR